MLAFSTYSTYVKITSLLAERIVLQWHELDVTFSGICHTQKKLS